MQLTADIWAPVRRPRRFGPGDTPIPNLLSTKGAAAPNSELQMQTLMKLNREFRKVYEVNTDIAARVQSYELARRMQLSAPAVVDFSDEPKHILDMYGIGEKETDDFGRQLLMSRRLAEKGVRYIQLCNGGGGNGSWDSHVDMKEHKPRCRALDKPIAGLLRDLKQRGMLDFHSGRIFERLRKNLVVAEYDGAGPQPERLFSMVCRRRREGRHDSRRDG